MADVYKIAVATTDGSTVDLSFGAAKAFSIYEVNGEEQTFRFAEKRVYEEPADDGSESEQGGERADGQTDSATPSGCGSQAGCGSAQGADCGSGNGCGSGGGCGGNGKPIPKLEQLSDCRCILAKKIGHQVQKQMEKKAMVGFDVDYDVEESLTKIVSYFNKVDHHQSLRGIANR